MANSKNKRDLVEEEVMEAELSEAGDAIAVEAEAEIEDAGDDAVTEVEETIVDDESAVAEGEVVDEAEPEEEQPIPALTAEDVRLVEAILFAAASPLDLRMIGERFPQERTAVIPAALEHLQEQYAARGVNLVQRERKWAFRTATDLGEQLRLEKEQTRKFTRAAMETMAIIAYHQPVTRAEIENIRGVATSAGALDALMEAGWIKPGKRREVPGRPVTWITTQVFLDHFGLERLADLPGMEELKASGLLDKRPAIEAMPGTSDLFGDDQNVDPNVVTDEDLIGRQDDENVEVAIAEAAEDDNIETDIDKDADFDADDESDDVGDDRDDSDDDGDFASDDDGEDDDENDADEADDDSDDSDDSDEDDEEDDK